MRRGQLLPAIISFGLVGCVDGFNGSNVQIDFHPFTPVQAPVGRAPNMGELPANIHFRLYAIKETDEADSLFELQRFEIHKLVDPTSPCFIDDGEHVPFPGLHVSQYSNKTAEATGITDVANPPPGATEKQKIEAATAIQRMSNVDALSGERGLKAVTTASTSTYPAVDADCNGTGLPPPACLDDASNARRLEICRDAWAADPALFEGTDRVLTSPLNGTTFGFVVGLNPVTPTPVGGAQFVVDDALVGVSEYAIYFQDDGVAEPGTLFLQGRPVSGATRGVSHVSLDSPAMPNVLTSQMAIFSSLGQDDTHF